VQVAVQFFARSNRRAGYMMCGPGPPCWMRRSRKGVSSWCSCMPPAWWSALSPTGLGEDGGVLVTAGRLHAPRAAVWHLSAIARLQGFSSGSLTASPYQWSRRRVTTSSMVGRSKPGCGLCPALSFKDLHHPCWGGGQAEPELYLPYGPAGHLFLQHSGERALIGLAEGADFDNAGSIGRKRRQLQHAWFAGSAGSGAASGATSHRWAEGGYLPAVRAAVAPRAPGDRPRRRMPLGRRSCSWVVPPLAPARRLRAEVGARPFGRT
jgi:hypothetical protein